MSNLAVIFLHPTAAIMVLFDGIESCGTGLDCVLSRTEISALVDDARVWNVTDTEIEEHGIQAIINCTRARDTVSLQTTQTIRPSTRVVIPHRLTVEGDGNGSENNSMTDRQASLTCPPNDGLFHIYRLVVGVGRNC